MNILTFPLSLAGPVPEQFSPPYPTQQCQVSDGGIIILVQVLDGAGNAVNLAAATKIKIITVRPSGLSLPTPATFYTNGLDGQVYFSTGVGTPFGAGLNEYGIWSVQCEFLLGGYMQYTSVGFFAVNQNLGV